MALNKDTNVFWGAMGNSEMRTTRIIRMIISLIVFTGLSLGLYFLRYQIPWAPNFLTTDFSVFTEFIAAIAYGPIIGTIVCLLKFVIAIIIKPTSYVSNIANFLIEVSFLITASVYYYRKNYKKDTSNDNGEIRQYRRRRIIIGSLIGMIPALIIQFFTNCYLVFPLLEKNFASYGYTKAYFIQQYQSSVDMLTDRFPGLLGKILPEITNLWQGIIIFNIPATFMKLLAVALITALIYPIISPFLHFNFNRKK